MKQRRSAQRTYFAAGAAILTFAVFLAFASFRIMQVERDLTSAFGEDLMHAILQAQHHGYRLALDARRWDEEHTPAAAEQVRMQYDLLLSRLQLFREGQWRRDIAAVGASEALTARSMTVIAFEPRLVAALTSRSALTPQVLEAVEPLISELRELARELVYEERVRHGAAQDRYRRTLLDVIGSVLGILVSGTVLSLRLIQELRYRSRTEQKLREQHDFSSLLLASSGDGIVAFDRDLQCTHWNAAMTRLLGIAPQNAVGTRLDAILPFADDHPFMAALRRTIDGVDVFLPEQDLSETGRFLETNSFPLRFAGEVIGGIAFVRDVTERNQAQRELARHRDQLEVLVEQRTADLQYTERQLVSAINTAPDGFAAFAADGRLLLANERMRSFWRDSSLSDGDLTLDSIVAATGPSDAGSDVPLAPVADGESWERRLTSGTWIQVNVHAMPDGAKLMRASDITPYKQATIALEGALRQERRLSIFYRDFVSAVSHQFRTPLAIIDSSVQRIMRRGDLMDAAEIRLRAEKVRSAAGRLLQLVESTLNSAKLDAGRFDWRPRACDLAELIRDVCERHQELAPERKFQIRIGPLPQVHCDPILIDQAIGNLISNAVKYSPNDTSIEVEATTGGDSVRIAVRDHGVGIAADEVPRLFERFFRARTAEGVAGTGIGLHLARQITELHGGDILVETAEGRGSTFTLTLPIKETAELRMSA
ncbi:ATP-binding protein [Chelatococcus sp. GCM10030263]|uniref:ATP-binding protein n=1 Tax=Chelatococcus sp. GCM10030263 TaxID=3273387 RepID=UPI003606ED4C